VGDGDAVGVPVGATVGVGVGVGVPVAVGVGDGPPAHPVSVHASQQLANRPTHADPPLGARQRSACCFSVQRVLPWRLVTQQVTDPAGLLHVEREAQRVTLLLQLFGS